MLQALEASGYTSAPTALHCCWGGCSPRRQRAPTHGDNPVPSQAIQIHHAKSVTSFPSYQVDGKQSYNWKTIHLKLFFSSPNKCPGFDHFGEEITRIWGPKLAFSCWENTDNHECDLHNSHISRGAEEATISAWPVPLYLHICGCFLKGDFSEDSPPQKSAWSRVHARCYVPRLLLEDDHTASCTQYSVSSNTEG